MDNFTFDTLDAATQGLLSNDSFSIAVQGLLTWVEIEVIPVPSEPTIEFQPGGAYYDAYSNKKPKEKIIKIRVTAIIDGVKHTEEKVVARLKKPKISDVNISISNDSDKKITISLVN